MKAWMSSNFGKFETDPYQKKVHFRHIFGVHNRYKIGIPILYKFGPLSETWPN